MNQSEKSNIEAICQCFNRGMVQRLNFLEAVYNAIEYGKENRIGSLKTIDTMKFLEGFKTIIDSVLANNPSEASVKGLVTQMLKSLCFTYVSPTSTEAEISLIIEQQIF